MSLCALPQGISVLPLHPLDPALPRCVVKRPIRRPATLPAAQHHDLMLVPSSVLPNKPNDMPHCRRLAAARRGAAAGRIMRLERRRHLGFPECVAARLLVTAELRVFTHTWECNMGEQSGLMRTMWRLAALLLNIAAGANASGLLGVDLGNANSVIATPRRGGVDVLVNEASHRQTPSVVAFDERQRLLGEGASSHLVSNPAGCAAELKARLDASFTGAEEQLLEVTMQGAVQHFSATQLLAMLMHHLCVTAASELKSVPSHCTIAVPLHFDAARRQAVLDAARIAGLRSTRLISDVRHTLSAILMPCALAMHAGACALPAVMVQSPAGRCCSARLCLRPR